MSSLSADTQRAIAVLIAGLAVVIALWMTVISSKRDDSSAASDLADKQEQRLSVAHSQLAANRAAKDGLPALTAELEKLDVAVPVRGDIADMLRELQAEARRRGADLRVVSLKPATAAGGGTTPVAGAQAGTNGLSTLPFDLQFTGRYQALLEVLRTVRRAVTVEKDGTLEARNRLLTIDGLSFERPVEEVAITKATLNATAYIASPLGAAAAAPAEGAPAGAAPAAQAAAQPPAATNTSVEVKP